MRDKLRAMSNISDFGLNRLELGLLTLSSASGFCGKQRKLFFIF